MSSDTLANNFSGGGVPGRARTQAFSLSSEDGESIHVLERREEYIVTPQENYFCDERHISVGIPSVNFRLPPGSSASASSSAPPPSSHFNPVSSSTTLNQPPLSSHSGVVNSSSSATLVREPSNPKLEPSPPVGERGFLSGSMGNLEGADGSAPISGPYANPYGIDDWRMRERMKTVSALLVLCLNIGVDPPDVIKTTPCAKLECWIDPFGQPAAKALESIGKNLQAQYEKWQPKSRYKVLADPTLDEVKKACITVRKSAKDERTLFHYNGHGVPKPTGNGEIWVFNKNFTQYIPLSIYDLQTWMGSPSIFVYDCPAAGHIVNAFNQFAEQRERECERMHLSNPTSSTQFVQPMRDTIQLAACRKDQVLPMHPLLPADLFTSCLTTPIDIALRWFILQNSLLSNISVEIIDKIPGRLNDRRTPLGELNWIFTAITDSIAWTVLPRDLFQKLFRQDLMVACLFRNFLLAERVMRTYNCTPISSPALPATHHHPLWQAWDLAVETFLMQFMGDEVKSAEDFDHSPFYNEQLTAFEVWLENAAIDKKPPPQLPIVLQVLLSQNHRNRALQLLARFLEFGPWAVNLALSVGLFPYILKLLQSPANELRKLLVHIWAKIICVDRSCQADLIKDNSFKYFTLVIWNPSVRPDERALAACVLANICADFRAGQQACFKATALSHCFTHLNDPDPVQRQWLCLCLAELWNGYAEAKLAAFRENAHERLQPLLNDPTPEVRAAAVFALGRLVGDVERTDEIIQIENTIAISLVIVTADSSPLVRKELVVALSAVVSQNEAEFRTTAAELWDEEQRKMDTKLEKRLSHPVILSKSPERKLSQSTPVIGQNNSQSLSVYQCIWKVLLSLSVDPFPEVAFCAQTVVDAVNMHIINLSVPSTPPATQKGQPSAPPGTPRKPPSALKNLFPSSDNLAISNSRPASPAIAPKRGPAFLKVPKIPVESTFFDWCLESFNKPITVKMQNLDPGSARFQEQIWKTRRNESVIRESKPALKTAAQRRFDDQVAQLENETDMISLVAFHPFEPLLVAADERDFVSVWDIEEGKRINKIFNQNPPGTRLTALELINSKDQNLLMIGSDEGVVRIWRDFESRTESKLVSSWRALTDLLPSTRGSGLITEWQQNHGSLLVSGDVRVIRLWDATKELCVQDIPTVSDSCVTSLTSNRTTGNLIAAGCGDGVVRLYDRRLPSRDSMIMTLAEHKGWVVSCHLQQESGEIISGSVSGDIRFWDLRSPNSHKTIETQGPLSALAVHERAPLLAAGSQNQYIKVFNHEGENLNTIRYHDGFLGQRIGPVSSIDFHPFKLLMAAGSTDSIVSVFS